MSPKEKDEIEFNSSIDGTKISWTTAGSGPSLLLAHALRSSMRTFDALEPALVAGGARVIRYDLPGHGGSSLGEQAQTLESCTAIITGVCRAANAQQPILFGEGFGAYLCLHAVSQGLITPRALLVWRPLLGPPFWGTQLLNQLTSVAADRLSARTLETFWPTEPADLLHTRARMTASVRALTEYAAILTSLERIRLKDFNDEIPVIDLGHGLEPSVRDPGPALSAALKQLEILTPRDR